MNTKTALKAVLGTVAGLGLTMAAVAFAQDGHMGTNTQAGGMMGQTTQQTTNGHGNMGGSQQNTHDGMHGNTQPTTDHHANSNQKTNDYPCHGKTDAKS